MQQGCLRTTVLMDQDTSSEATAFSPYLEEFAQLASSVPDLAVTLTTQAEEDAEDDNISFLRSELLDEDESNTADDVSESRRRMRRAVNALLEPRVYTPAQLHELGDPQEPTYSDRTLRPGYHGWAPGASDEQEDNSLGPLPAPSQSSTALLDEQVLRRDEHLRDRIGLRRLRDTTQPAWRESLPSLESMSRENSPPVENAPDPASIITETSLRATALLQTLRRNPQITARSRNELQRYILDRERVGHGNEDRDRATATRLNEASASNSSPSQRRQMHREAAMRHELEHHRVLLADHQTRRNQLEAQPRQQRQGYVPTAEIRRRRFGHTPSPCPPNGKISIDDAIRYLERLRLCESDEEARETAEDGGFHPEEGSGEKRHDFLLDTTGIPPPPESSWLRAGGILSGHQHATPAYPGLPSYTPLMPPSTYRARTRIPGLGPPLQRTTSPTGISPQIPVPSADRSPGPEERWPVRLTIQGIDHSTMTLSGIMEAFNVPDKTSPTRFSSITTFLEGEIIDFNNFTLKTKSFTAGTRVDGIYWRKLPPFKDCTDDDAMVRNLISKEWLRKELMEKYILMRWKEKCFVRPPQQSALTISGFYYISLRREDGCVEGLYYDPGCTPYQHLSLVPETRIKTFPAYKFQ